MKWGERELFDNESRSPSLMRKMKEKNEKNRNIFIPEEEVVFSFKISVVYSWKLSLRVEECIWSVWSKKGWSFTKGSLDKNSIWKQSKRNDDYKLDVSVEKIRKWKGEEIPGGIHEGYSILKLIIDCTTL